MRIDRKFLPSRNFLIALSTAIVIILLAIIISSIDYSSKKQNNFAIDLTSTSTQIENTIDTDEDGLFDWLETLYSTNPNKKDTDEDGTKDGQEIKELRDPTKANTAEKGKEPNDKIDPSIIEKDKSISEEYQRLNPTEKIARNIISDILASQPVNGTMDEQTMNTILQKTMRDIPQKTFSGTTTIADLNLVKIDNDIQQDLLNYANSYYKETEVLRKIMGTDLSIMMDYMSKEKVTDEKKLSEVISKYQSVVNNLIKMPLSGNPQSFGVYYHLRIINNIEKIIAIDKDIINSKKDNLNILSDLSIYNSTSNDLIAALSVVDLQFKIQRTN